MTNEQTSTAQEEQSYSDLDYYIGKLQHAFEERENNIESLMRLHGRQRSSGRRQRLSRLAALEIIWRILRLLNEKGV